MAKKSILKFHQPVERTGQKKSGGKDAGVLGVHWEETVSLLLCLKFCPASAGFDELYRVNEFERTWADTAKRVDLGSTSAGAWHVFPQNTY